MEKVRCIVLIQKDLYEQIRAMAQWEHRSLSAQIVHLLLWALHACRFSLWRVTAPVKQLKLGKAPDL
jgi:hypothetical protein